LCATVNSDNPAYFGGCIDRNFVSTFTALPLAQHPHRELR
jgi:adenine deaminase